MTEWVSGLPSAQLQRIFEIASKFAEAEDAPAVRLEHFLWAALLDARPSYAEKILSVAQEIRDEWRESL